MKLENMSVRRSTTSFLFDLDGVLVDSMPQAAVAVREWAQRHGLDADRVVKLSVGLPDRDLVRRVAPHLDPIVEAQAIERHEEALASTVAEMPGARRLLDSLAGEPWAVVTSSSLRVARQRLDSAGLPIPQILVTADDVERGKPDPEPYVKAACLVGQQPESCIAVEDSPAGVAAARRAGVFVVGLANDVEGGVSLPEADVTVARLDQVLPTVRTRLGERRRTA